MGARNSLQFALETALEILDVSFGSPSSYEGELYTSAKAEVEARKETCATQQETGEAIGRADMKAWRYAAGFLLLIALGAGPALYWIFNGDAYCSGHDGQEQRNFKPSVDSYIDRQGSSEPQKNSFPEWRMFTTGTSQAANQQPYPYRQANDGDRKPGNRVIELLCEAKLTDLLLALFTYCLVIVGGYQGYFLWEAGQTANAAAQATRLQAIASVSERIPIVIWADIKMVEVDGNGNAVPDRDPVLGGDIPEFWRPVYVIRNMGPTRIITEFYATKIEARPNKELDEEPHFGGMFKSNVLIQSSETHPYTPQESVKLSQAERKAIDSGEMRLWAYSFVQYRDFMNDLHRIGAIAKWDPNRGFIQVERKNYSYHHYQKSW